MSVKKLHMDFETYSEVDIRDVGAYRYAADPSTTVLCCSFAFDDESPKAWHPSMDATERRELDPYFDALRDPSVLILAHNCMFERAIFEYVASAMWGIPFPDASRFHCTMSMARRAALPAKLETLAEVLELPIQKDNRGKALIKKFSMPQIRVIKKYAAQGRVAPFRILPSEEPDEFAVFLEYCQRDVAVEQLVFRKLEYFFEPINNKNYSLDAVINARGVPVNLDALRHAQRLIDEETQIVSTAFRELVGFEVTQNARLLEWANREVKKSKVWPASFTVAQYCQWMIDNEEKFPNLQAETVDSFLELWEGKTDVPDLVIALRMKQSLAYAAPKKVMKMLMCAGPHDNRIRGMLSHHAATTGRWGANLVQTQNLKRPTIKFSEHAYRMICNHCTREELEIMHGPVLEVISSVIRHFLEDTE